MNCVHVLFIALIPCLLRGQALNVPWSGYAHDPQHTAISANASQPVNGIHWCTPVDLDPPGGGSGPLFIHYGSPIVTAANTVLVPVKTGSTDGFEIQAFQVSTSTPPQCNSGTLANQGFIPPTPLYTLTTDYSLPAHDWFPPYGPVLSIRNRLYYPGAGGTVYYRDSVDSATGPTGQIAFYGNALYNGNGGANKALFNSTVQICTPITTDRYGSIYFGFVVTGSNPANLTSGLAKITITGAITGAGSWIAATSMGTSDGVQVAMNAAPALSNNQGTVYVALSNGAGAGDLVSLNSATLQPTSPASHVHLLDPLGGAATVTTNSSASPMVGPDGDVYFGVLENSCCTHNDRGWMLHFDSTLTQTKLPGSFGWDDTATVVTSTLVPSYTGTSSYLILTKYNNYIQFADGQNKVAILDPNASMPDEYSNGAATVMKEVITILGPTPDGSGGVREWCINTAAVDPFTKSALVNSEDGVMYRWDFTTNTFTQRLTLTGGISEAYTPTAIGVDGTVYAINDTVLFAVGN